MLPLSSGSNNKSSKEPSLLASYFMFVFFLGLIFEPEDGIDLLLQNVGWLSWTTWHYIPEYRIQQKEFSFCEIS
jgi:hypothetical protein